MRDILFRGMRTDEDEWVTGSYIKEPYGSVIQVNVKISDGTVIYRWIVDPETVCQYTGWRDNHKQMIFENDIVEFVSGTSLHRYLIWWQREGSMLTAVPLDGIAFNGSDYWNGKFPQFDYSTFCFMMLDPYGDFRDIRVVGNIHDNPELLEE